MPVDQAVTSVILLVGLAVGVDYSLFYLRREREERARGPQPEDGAASRGGDLGPRGAGLRPDRHGRHGRDVLHRRQRRSRRSPSARSSSSPSRCSARSRCCPRCFAARRPGREGPHPVPGQAAPAPARGEPRVWSCDPRPRAGAPARLGRRSAGGLLIALAIPALGMHTANSGTDGAAAQPADHADLRPHPGRVPRRRVPAIVVGPGRRRHRRRSRPAIATSSASARAPGQFERPISIDVSPDQHVAAVDMPLAGTGTDARPDAALAQLRDHLIPAHRRQVAGRRRRRHRQTAGVQGLQRPDEVARCRSCSRSSWRWPSCCCW